MEEGEPEHEKAGGKGGHDAVTQGLQCSVLPPRPDVLGHEGGHGLHIGRRHQHDEGAQPLRHAQARGKDQALGVDNGQNQHEGQAHQQVLQGDGRTQPQDAADEAPVPGNVVPPEAEGQLFPADDEPGDEHAHGLGQHRGPGGAHGPQVEAPDEEQVGPDIDQAGQGHRDQGHFGIPQPAEDGAQQVVGGDEHEAAGADPHVGPGLGEGLSGSLHQLCHPCRLPHQHRGEDGSQDQEQAHACADGLARPLGPAFADELAHLDGDAHGQAGDDAGEGVHDLAACGHAGDVGGGREAAHHPQVHRAVGRLQQQGQQHRQGKSYQGQENAAGCEIGFLFHGSRSGPLSCSYAGRL